MTRVAMLAAAGFALLAGGGSSPVEPGLDRDFELAGGASARVDGTELVIRFTGVPNDSRCPVDVRCVTEGDQCL